MKKTVLVTAFIGLGAFSLYLTHTGQNRPLDEIEEFVPGNGETNIIPPLTTDIRKVPQKIAAQKKGADRAPASAMKSRLTPIKSPLVDPTGTKANPTQLLQAYRNELLSLNRNSSDDQRLIQEILDYVQSAPADELPVSQITQVNREIRLASPIDESKFREPEIRVKYRRLTGIRPNFTDRNSK